MFKLLLVISAIFSAFAFNPLGSATVSRMQMASESKVFGAALIASSMLAMPVLAVEGTPAKIGIFTNNDLSSPYASGEVREDPIYSPYSPYGDGTAAVYKRGGAEEIKFYTAKFDEGIKRVSKVPSYTEKKTWSEITTELTRFTYSLRESMLRLAESSSNPKEAKAAAEKYFSDIEDIFVFATKKDGKVVLASYEKSLTDLAAYKALIK